MNQPEEMACLGTFWVPEPAFEGLFELQAANLKAEVRQELTDGKKKYGLYVQANQLDLARAALMKRDQAERKDNQRMRKMEKAQNLKEEAGKRWSGFGKLLFALGLLGMMGAYATPATWLKPFSVVVVLASGLLIAYGFLRSVR